MAKIEPTRIDGEGNFQTNAHDDLDALIEQGLEGFSDSDDSDDAGLTSPLPDDPGEEVLSVEDGMKAMSTSDAPKAPEEADKAEGEESKPDEAEKADEGAAENAKADEADEAEKAEEGDTDALNFATVLEKLDPKHRPEVAARLAQSRELDEVFAPYAKDMAASGTSMVSAVRQVMAINSFASQSPLEYLQWFAKQVNAEDPTALLREATSALNPDAKDAAAESKDDDDDDDLFEDEETRALKEQVAALQKENETLKAAPQPQAPAVSSEAQQTLANFVNERDSQTGELVRPHFDTLRDIITRNLAVKQGANGGKPVTLEDLQEAYDQAALGDPRFHNSALQAIMARRAAAAQPENAAKSAKPAPAKPDASSIIDGPSQSAAGSSQTGPDSLDAEIDRQLDAAGL